MVLEEHAIGRISCDLWYIPLRFPGLPEEKERVHGAPGSTGQQYCMYAGTEKAFCGNLESQRDRCGRICPLGVLLDIFLSVTKVVANMFFLVLLLPNKKKKETSKVCCSCLL